MKEVKSQASQTGAPRKQGGLNTEIQARIGHQLRAMYDDVVRQGVPDRFASPASSSLGAAPGQANAMARQAIATRRKIMRGGPLGPAR